MEESTTLSQAKETATLIISRLCSVGSDEKRKKSEDSDLLNTQGSDETETESQVREEQGRQPRENMTEREDGGIYDFLCLSGSLYAPLLRTLRRLAYPVGKVVEVGPTEVFPTYSLVITPAG